MRQGWREGEERVRRRGGRGRGEGEWWWLVAYIYTFVILNLILYGFSVSPAQYIFFLITFAPIRDLYSFVSVFFVFSVVIVRIRIYYTICWFDLLYNIFRYFDYCFVSVITIICFFPLATFLVGVSVYVCVWEKFSVYKFI